MKYEARGTRREGQVVLLMLVGMMLAGCGGTPVRESFFTLSAPSAASVPQSASPAIFVGPVSVPEAVDRTQMVLRTGANEVEISEQYRWAEPLKNAIPRVIGETLMRELGTSRVLTSRTAAALPVDYRIAIEVQRFESSLQSGATVDALWTITKVDGGRRRAGRTLATENAGGDAASLAAAHGRALDRVGRDIAAALKSGG
jgi:uncharacterized lipoprotein YmbA